MNWLWYILIGLAAGIVSGMGIGGGAVLIPALTILLSVGQREAQHINLLFFIPTAIFALRTHVKEGNIEKKGLLKLALFGVMGVVPAALIAVRMDANWLRKGFAVFLLCMAVYELVKGYKKWKQGKKNNLT
ncbi:MAG: sulfite exporter TauE/SafE family protein [Defluviitaleaceae bacterium]|nr:sulfite exporter TauE/SafE family protein [Defluviitaleaceae bacterium]MCL2275500.1 sulfite exporter TauE/SafE family protein [Defluviitaleaceae bacterium]